MNEPIESYLINRNAASIVLIAPLGINKLCSNGIALPRARTRRCRRRRQVMAIQVDTRERLLQGRPSLRIGGRHRSGAGWVVWWGREGSQKRDEEMRAGGGKNPKQSNHGRGIESIKMQGEEKKIDRDGERRKGSKDGMGREDNFLFPRIVGVRPFARALIGCLGPPR